jgi:long-chain acyl-CoA synthetase
VTETAAVTRTSQPSAGERTITRLWRNAVVAGHPGPAYLVETEVGWHEISWKEADERVRAYANGLLALGVGKGTTFAILARNSLDWALLDFALAQIGAVTVPVYASSSPHDVGYVVGHSEAVGVVCEDEEQFAKVT